MSRREYRLWLQLPCVAAAFWTQPARSVQPQEPHFDVVWSAPEGCPTAADIRAKVRRLLGPTRSPGAQDDIVVRATASRHQSGRWLGIVETRLGAHSGSRSLYAESCEAVAGTTALIVALMVDPAAVATQQAVAASNPSLSAPARLKPATSEPKSVGRSGSVAGANPPSSAATEPWRAQLTFGPQVAANAGVLPQMALAFGAHVGLLTRYGSVELGYLDWSRSSATIPQTQPTLGGDFKLRSGFVAVCPSVRTGAFDWGGCAKLAASWLSGVGTGVSSPYGNSSHWFALGLGAVGRFRLSEWVSIPAYIEADAPLARPTFVLNGVSESGGRVHTPGKIGAVARLGLDFTW